MPKTKVDQYVMPIPKQSTAFFRLTDSHNNMANFYVVSTAVKLRIVGLQAKN